MKLFRAGHVVSILLLVFLSACALVQSSEQHKQTDSEQSDANDLSVTIAVERDNSAYPDTSDGKPSFWSVPINWTRVLAVVGIFGLVVAVRSLRAVEDQAIATGDSAAAASSAAAAAHQANATTRALERARFRIDERKIEQTLGTTGLIRVTYQAINQGRSVAYVTRSCETMFLAPALPQPAAFPPLEANQEVLQAGEPLIIQLTQRNDWTREMKVAFNERKSFLHIVGLVEYRDVFGDMHLRGYGFSFDAESNDFHPPKPDGGYNFET